MNRAERRRQERRHAATDSAGFEAARRRWSPWLGPVLIVIASIAAYGTSFDGVFVLDDIGHIVDTTTVRDLGSSFSGSRPLVRLSLAVNYAIGGLEPRGYHVFNLAVHLLAALTLYGIVRRTLMTIETPPHLPGAAPWLAMTVALLWAVHPLQTQSVTYVVQRGESMMGLFYFLSLYTVLRGTDARRAWAWYTAAVVACALGMTCKAVMVTAPVMILIYDRLFLAGSWRAVLSRWPLYVGLAATWGVLVACGTLSVFDASAVDVNVGFGYRGVTWLEYARTQPEIILHYLRLCVWPASLCLDYAWSVRPGWAIAGAAAAPLVILVGAALMLLARGHRSAYLGLWFFVILAPTSSVIPIRDLAFEHRMYLSLAGVIAAVVLGADLLLRRLASRGGMSDRRRRAIAATAVGLVTIALGARTAVRNRDYASALRIWQSIVEQRPENDRAHQNLGSALLQEGRIDEAADHSRRAVELNPENGNAHVNLATISLQRRAFDEALGHLTAAIRVQPENAIARNNLGSLHATRGQMDLAYEQFVEAVRLQPNYTTARSSLGRILASRGDREGALREYRAVLTIDPGNEQARAAVARLMAQR